MIMIKPTKSLAQRNRNKKVYCKITKPQLSDLFEVPETTITGWIQHGNINPYSLTDIIYKYNNRHLLDRRRRDPTNKGS